MKLILILFLIGLVTSWFCDRDAKRKQKEWQNDKSERPGRK